MNIETLRDHILLHENVTEGFPFGEDVLVFKVNNKIFLLVSLDTFPLQFNVKCDPDKAITLREEYPENIFPGYHMNKKHWNTVVVSGLKINFLKQLIDDSYYLVAKMKK